MGKKKGGKSSGKVSQGLRRSSMKTAIKDPGIRLMNQLKAFRVGKNVVLTIENPNKNETNKRFIRVPASQVWKKA
jgi:hypothetical protein